MSPRLPIVTPREVIRALKKVGFVVHHQTGSHVALRHESGRRVTVPHHNNDLKRGTLRSILHQAQLSVAEFSALL